MSLFDLLEFAIKTVEEKEKVDYVEVRGEQSNNTYVELREGIVNVAKRGITKGVSIRVFYKGAWGFSSTSILTKDSVRQAALQALESAKIASQALKMPKKIYLTSSLKDKVRAKLKVNPLDVSFEEKLNNLFKLNSEIYKEGKDFIKSVTIRYADLFVEKYYMSNEGRQIYQEYCITWNYLWAVGRRANVVGSAREEIGCTEGYVIFEKWPIEELAKTICERVKKQLEAVPPKGGIYPAVIAPNVVGVLAHEAFGHLAEADLTLSGSAILDKLGKKIASEKVTIIDDPTIPNAFGTIKYDDEGIEAKKAVLIEKGVIKGLMHNRETSALMGAEPTGNARAQNFNVQPLIRMRNTIIQRGECEIEELFEGIKFGYYLKSFRGGQANLDGTFQVGIQEAYEIVNGEIRRPVRNLSISGNTLKTLAEVDAVAKDFELEYGRCGKGQLAYVCSGGPHIRVKGIVIGGVA